MVVTGLGVERFGFRKFILGVLLYQACMTTIYFTAQSIEVLMVGYVFGGIAFGVFMSGK
jgi:SP family general alpha glucoside:H+ symporter-like MFS transporter